MCITQLPPSGKDSVPFNFSAYFMISGLSPELDNMAFGGSIFYTLFVFPQVPIALLHTTDA